MRSSELQLEEILRRADTLRRQKASRRAVTLSAASVCVCLALIVGALALSTTFHGLYNLLVSAPGASSYIGYVLPLLTAGLLAIPYRRLRGRQAEEDAPGTN